MSADECWPEGGFEHLGRCPVCGDEGRVLLYADLSDRVFHAAPGQWRMHRCGGCGSAYLDPRPNEATIHLAYRDYHTHRSPAEDRKRSAAVRFGRSLLHGYLNSRFRYDFRPALRVGVRVVPLVPGGSGLASMHVRALPLPDGEGRLLDVGCGNGEFLARMRAAGWQVEGLDPDPAAVELAKRAGLAVDEGTLSSVEPRLARYDAITLSHVIEHVHDPLATLQACYAALRPGGVIWIDTPNLEARGHRRFGRDWFPLEPPRHLAIFTASSLRSLLERAGFTALPDPPVVLSAFRWSYRLSNALRLDASKPFEAPPSIGRVLAAHALIDDLRTLARPREGEELVAMALRPESPGG